MCGEATDLKKTFEYVREIVKHEDTLTNFRTTWTLVFQGFLFTTLVGGVGLFERVKFQTKTTTFHPIVIGITIICLLGALSSVAAFFGVKAAEKQLKATTTWWTKKVAQSEDSFPPIYVYPNTLPGASVYFIVLGIVWVGLAALVLYSASTLTLLASTH